jgi:phage tail sheath protein FI
MPEYLAPGVYVEEVSYRSRSIEGVSTSTTGFVGPTRYGPVEGDIDVLTSLIDFERVYGDRQPLVFQLDGDTTETRTNFMWQAARAYFENGGARLYVKRVFNPVPGDANDGRATARLDAPGGGTLRVSARFPGTAGARTVQLTLQCGPNVLVQDTAGVRAVGLQGRDVVVMDSTAGSGYGPRLALVTQAADGSWQLEEPPSGDPPAPPSPVPVRGLSPADVSLRVLTLTLTDVAPDPDTVPVTWSALPLDPQHQRAGVQDSVFAVFTEHPANRALAMSLPVILSPPSNADGAEIAALLLRAQPGLLAAVTAGGPPGDRTITLRLASGGNDGQPPAASDYEGGTTVDDSKLGLVAFEDIEDISIVAAPGSTFGYETSEHSRLQGASVHQALISHCERMRYRIAVLDCGDGQSVSMVRQMRAHLDSDHAALYYPWVTVVDPVTQAELQLPPSGFVCGIYARNDIERAVYKAPANEVVTLAVGFEKMLNKGQQDVLNPEGVNCFRYFPGRGMRLWGARTATSDPEWKYVNLRRYFAYLEHSIDRGTQWAVFEPNGERLWASLRRTIQDFLLNEWQMGALLGDKPEKAFFVKCDRTTMTQNDLDNGRLVCLIGVAPLRPAEYVIFRIGQWTADSRA